MEALNSPKLTTDVCVTMSDDIVKKKFDEGVEKLKRKHWLLITGCLALFFLLSLLANIFQLIDSANFKELFRKLNGLGSVPIVAALPAFILLAVVCLVFWSKERTVRKHLEEEKSDYFLKVNQNLLGVKEEIKEIRELTLTDQVGTKGEFYALLQHLLVSHKGSSIYIVDLHREWSYKFVFSLFISRCQTNRIVVLSQERTEDEKRNRLLTSVGCELYFIDESSLKDKFKGVIVDPDKNASCQAIRLLDNADPTYAVHYYGESHFPVVRLFCKEISGLIEPSSVNQGQREELPTPSVSEDSEQAILDGMQKITFYRNADFEFRDVSVADVTPVSSFVEIFKFRQAQEILDTYKRKQVSKFKPMLIQFGNNKTSTILPPILEERNGKLYVAEGHSRLYCVWTQDSKARVRVIVVKGIKEGFTTVPTEWDKVILTHNKIPLGENGQLLARNIEAQYRD